MKNIFVFLFLLAVVNSLTGQHKDSETVLFRIDGKPVYVSEFLHIYEKNKNAVIDEEEKNLSDYLDLFINYKLKLLYAYEQHIDDDPAILNELKTYREQLTLPFLTQPKTNEKLTREAYYRTKNQVNVSHILVRVKPDAKPEDTLKAFNRITNIRNKILNGKSFKEMAEQYSEDPSAKQNGGNLGYFSAFQMVYPFENAAFQTAVGQVSEPFRTQFGYHIVKVNAKRPSPGEIEIAHIFIKKKPEDTAYAKNQIFSIYQKLKQGEDFAYLAKKHSDDTFSAAKGGVMPVIKPGSLIQPFDSIAFGIQKIGDYTKPFQSNGGWHIFKLIKKHPVPDYESLQKKLAHQVKNSSRSVIVVRTLADSLSNILPIVNNETAIHKLLAGRELDKNTELFRINNQKYTLNNYLLFKKKHYSVNERETFSDYKAESIVNYYKAHLENYNTKFAKTLQEYKDGLLLFNVLQKKVWKPAETDSIGLKTFFEQNRNRYKWKERAKVLIATCTKKEIADQVRKMLLENKSATEIKELLNQGPKIHVLFNELILEKGDARIPASVAFKPGVSPVIEEDRMHYLIVKVLETYPSRLKKLSEVRGQVMNDYQNELEKQWIAELRKEHEVKINKKAVKALKKRLKTE